MRLIAASQRVENLPQRAERRDCLDQRWADFLAECGCSALALPNRPAIARRMLESFDVAGMLLTGGGDLAAYGGDSPERDATEREMIEFARERKLPVLGICRGMQTILDYFGVPLVRVAGHVTPKHEILIDGRPATVNSYHGYAATTSTPELEVWAKARDEVIEAIRHRDEPIVGVMWHPEREAPFAGRDLAMVRAVFAPSGA